MDGFGLPSQIVEKAKSLGRTQIALTDHGSISGFVGMQKACKEEGLKPIYGCEFYTVDSLARVREEKERKKYHLTVIARNLEGYRNLLKLSTLSHDTGFYYKPTIDQKMLFEHAEGLTVLSGCWSGMVQNLLQGKDEHGALKKIGEFQEALGENYRLETQHFPLFKDTIDGLSRISEKTGIPIVLTCDPHYLEKEQAPIQEVLHAIRDRREFDRNQIIYGAYQWPAEDLFQAVSILYPEMNWEELFQNTVDVGNACNVEMPIGGVPRFPLPEGKNAYDTLVEWCKLGIKARGFDTLSGNKAQEYMERIKKELGLIKEKDFSDYFLIVADMVKWAKDHQILVGPARGSSAGSLVCYLLGINEINPLDFGLIFERFIDSTRYDLPDIDIDFDDIRRDEVKRYLSEKYGSDRVCNIATFATFKGRNSLDEIGRIFKLPKDEIETVKKYLIDRSGADMRGDLTIMDTIEMAPEAKEIVEKHSEIQYAVALEGQLRHMGTHAAGMIIGDRPLTDVMALYSREGDDKKISSFEMSDLKEIDLLKIDTLGIKELNILSEVGKMIGWTIENFYAIDLTDELTMQGFRNIDVEGIFQFVGDSTKSVLRQIPDLQYFGQLVDCVTLSKPGPSHAGSTTKYIDKAMGKKGIEGFDWHPILEEITRDTHHQILYQEQVIRIVKEVGNMSFSDANSIRNFMSKSVGEQAFESFWPAFRDGAIGNGMEEKQAKNVWENTKTMGRWSFNKSHAVSYAMLAWWSMYAKQHHPVQFYLARLMRTGEADKQWKLLYEMKSRGIKVLPPKIGKSGKGWAIEGEDALRAGLTEIKGVGESMATKIMEADAKTMEELKAIKGIGAKRIETFTELGLFNDDDSGDYFNLARYEILDKFAPSRTELWDIEDHSDGYQIEVAGIFIEMNYKDMHEEARSRGRSSENLKSPEISKYAMLLLQDSTDRCLVHANRFLFKKVGQSIWDAYANGDYVVVKGMKIKGWRMVRATSVEVYNKQGVKIA